MPSTRRASVDSPPVGSIEEALVSLKLSTKDPEQNRKLDHVLHVLRDVLSGPNIMVCCEDQEALWWEMFAEVFASEVAAQTQEAGGKEPSSSCKRQILADILVWAEVTQDHYDSGTQRFVTEPHDADESFQRIGRTFRAVKASKGLGSGDSGASSNAGARCSGNSFTSESGNSDVSSETRG